MMFATYFLGFVPLKRSKERVLRFSCCTAIVAVILLAGGAGLDAVSQQKPTVGEIVSVTQGVFASLEAAYAHSDAVVRVKVEAVRPAPALPRETVRSLCQCRVLDVLKGASIAVGGTITIRRTGGVRDDGDVLYETRIEGFPAFEPGDEMVVFLYRNGEVWVVGSGAEGTFFVRNGHIVPAGPSDVAKRHAGKGVADFVRMLKAYRGK